MEIQCPHNSRETMVTYMRNKTGKNWFRIYYKNSTCIRFTPKEVGRVFGIAKFTPTVNEIRNWCKEMVEKYDDQFKTEQMESGRDQTGEVERETQEPMVV